MRIRRRRIKTNNDNNGTTPSPCPSSCPLDDRPLSSLISLDLFLLYNSSVSRFPINSPPNCPFETFYILNCKSRPTCRVTISLSLSLFSLSHTYTYTHSPAFRPPPPKISACQSKIQTAALKHRHSWRHHARPLQGLGDNFRNTSSLLANISTRRRQKIFATVLRLEDHFVRVRLSFFVIFFFPYALSFFVTRSHPLFHVHHLVGETLLQRTLFNHRFPSIVGPQS